MSDRHKTEAEVIAALQEREADLRGVIMDSADGILVTDARGVVLFANPVAEEILGRGYEEVVDAYFGMLVSSQGPIEVDVVKPDGCTVPVEFWAGDTHWRGQSAFRISVRDITERRAARKRIEHLNRVLRAIRDVNQLIVREGTPSGLIHHACDILVSTRSFRAVWIALMDESRGMTDSACAGLDGTGVSELFSSLEAGTLPSCCRRAHAADSAIVTPVPEESCSACPVRDVHAETVAFTACLRYRGKIYGYLAVYAESCPGAEAEELLLLTEIAGDLAFALHGIESAKTRRDAEAAVRRERDFTQSLVDTAQAIVLVLDPDGRIVRFNPYMEDLCGIPLSEVRGKSWFDTFLPERNREKIRALFKTAVGGTRTQGNVNSVLSRDGGERLVEWYDSTLKDEDGRITGLLAIGHDVTARIAAERAREEANTRLAAAVKAASVGLWDYYLQENRAHFSDEWKRQLGYEPHEVGNSADEWSGRLHEEDRDRVLRILSDYVEGGAQGEYSAEFRLRHRDGSYRWVLSQGAAVESEAGVVTRMLGCHIDITESKRIEEQLRCSEKRLSEAQAIAHVGSWELNLATNELFWSEEIYRIFELDPDGAPPDYERFLQCIHPDDRAMVDKIYTESVTNHAAYTVEHRLLFPDGRVKHVIECCETFYDAAGNPVRSVGTTQDITEHKLADDALRASEERFRRSIMAAPFPAMVHAEDGEVVLINDVWEELTGYAIGEIPTVDAWTERAYGERSDQVEAVIDSLYAQDSRVDEGEFTICCKDGSTRIWAFASAPLGRDSSGRRLVLSMAKDVTENKAMANRVRQSEKLEAIGQLAGGVAHDFNNLIMGIMNYVELCCDALEPDHPVREWLDEITADAQRSADLTRQLLAFARKQTIAPKVLDLNDHVAGMLKMLRRLIGEDIDLAWEPGANVGLVRIDPSQVDQMLANLCVNARDAIGGVGKITIETDNVELDGNYCDAHVDAVPGVYVMLAVSDTGCGMKCETLERVFEPFFTTKGIGQGTGLGLATVHGIVKQNEGHINVYSESGEGTTFRIFLPRFADATDDMDRPETDNVPRGGSETILLVEDEKSIRVTSTLFLEELGYTVLTAESPEQALALATRHSGRIHMLITDVVMPGMSGRNLADRLIGEYSHLKILYMSGYTANIIAHRGVIEDGVEFLSKPFTRDVLARKVRDVLDG